MKNTNFYQSLLHAIHGFASAVKRERNLRFHLVIANLICYFGYFYGLERLEWGLLAVTITLVIGTEVINTSIEKTVDTATRERRTDAKHAKDIGAAATLTTAVGALAVGIILFANSGRIGQALERIFTNPAALSSALVLGALDVLFLFLPVFITKKIRRKR